VTSATERHRHPTWSPDRTKIAFARGVSGGNYDIFVQDLTQPVGPGNPVNITASPGSNDDRPAWAPNGDYIAFERGDGAVLPTAPDRDIVVSLTNGGGQTNITNTVGTDDAPAWSPDGGRIAFETDRDGNREIYVMNADGSAPVNLTNNPDQAHEPSWSPDGQRIAFRTDRDGNDEIYSVTPTGSPQTRLTNDAGSDSEPAWSPDASKIAFRSTRDGNPEVYLMGAGGSSPTRLTTTSQFDAHPDWQSVAPGYPRPISASFFVTSLVPAYQQCNVGNRQHGPPLASASCGPPVQRSTSLTVGTFDANGAAPSSIGSLRHGVQVGAPGPPDDSNDKIIFSLTDVRCVSGVTACSGGALSDYTGELEVVVSMRITDKNNSVAPGGGSDAATVADTPYSFIAPCAATAGAAGASCALTSSANALTPGLILDGKRTLVEFGRARVFDGGPDGLVATAPNTLFATQGLFVP